jgi:hypothetical protein
LMMRSVVISVYISAVGAVVTGGVLPRFRLCAST